MCIHNIPFQYKKKKKILNYPKYAAMELFLGTQFEAAMVNEPLVFEPLKVCCIAKKKTPEISIQANMAF